MTKQEQTPPADPERGLQVPTAGGTCTHCGGVVYAYSGHYCKARPAPQPAPVAAGATLLPEMADEARALLNKAKRSELGWKVLSGIEIVKLLAVLDTALALAASVPPPAQTGVGNGALREALAGLVAELQALADRTYAPGGPGHEEFEKGLRTAYLIAAGRVQKLAALSPSRQGAGKS